MNNTQNTKGTNEKAAEYRPQLAFYHPNTRGTGSAVKFELHPAHGNSSGCIMMSLANQFVPEARARQDQPQFARFDWERRIVVKFDFADLSHMLMVFKGVKESIGDQKGLYHRSANAVTRILLRHVVEPVVGYSLDVYRTDANKEERKAHIFLSDPEVIGLSCAIEGSMSVIAFGIPKIIPHDTSAYRAQYQAARASEERGNVRAMA